MKPTKEQADRAEPSDWTSLVLRRKLGTPTTKLSTPRGEMWIWSRPESRLIVTAASGHASPELGQGFLEVLERSVAAGAAAIWDDWARVTSYDSGLRIQLTDWTKAHPELAKNSHILVGSKLMAMGLSVANMLLGGVLQISADRARFERELELALR